MTARLPAILSIYLPKQGFVNQGKFCLIDGKPFFVANMTERKWWKNFGGYAIAKRVLDELPRGTKIIYKRVDLNQYYQANKSLFQKKGILVKYNHTQWVLPLKNWKVFNGQFENEPHDLPVMELGRWVRGQTNNWFDLYDLKKEWETKYA